MGFVEAVKTVFSKYFVFSGRATRPEYWFFTLFVALCDLTTKLLDLALGTHSGGPTGIGLFSVLTLANIIPHFAVGFRRLHDTGHSGWWFGGSALLVLAAASAMIFLKPLGVILYVGVGVLALVQLYWLCEAGTPGDSRYGPPPPTAPNAATVPE